MAPHILADLVLPWSFALVYQTSKEEKVYGKVEECLL